MGQSRERYLYFGPSCQLVAAIFEPFIAIEPQIERVLSLVDVRDLLEIDSSEPHSIVVKQGLGAFETARVAQNLDSAWAWDQKLRQVLQVHHLGCQEGPLNN